MSERTEHLHCSMVLEWDPEDEVYVVTVPQLPGCRSHGTTYEEATRQGKDAYRELDRRCACSGAVCPGAQSARLSGSGSPPFLRRRADSNRR